MPSKRVATVEMKNCAACGACTKECPKNAVFIWKGCYAKVDEAACVGCGKCAGICPAGCITVKERS